MLATALAASGADIIGIARGARFEAIRTQGLTLRSPDGDMHATFTAVASPTEITFRDGDVIFLTVKIRTRSPH